MKKVRKILLIFLGICLACTTVSCAKRTKVKKGDSYIYCLNSDRTGLQKVSYESKEKDPLKAAKAMIKELKKPSEEIEYTPPIPKDVKVKRYELEGGILYLDFNAKYKQMDTVEETLVRAALVKSLVRIEGINSVWIKVEGADLTDRYSDISMKMILCKARALRRVRIRQGRSLYIFPMKQEMLWWSRQWKSAITAIFPGRS